MRTRTHEEETPAVLQIPEKIQKDIEEKGFHLYKWISPDEVKLSIQRDFLKTLKYVGLPLGILAIIMGLLTVVGFFITIFFGTFLMFLYLFILSLKRSFLLSKSAFVVITDSSISLGGKIVKLSDFHEVQDEMKHIESQFEEELFESSRLDESKTSLTESVMNQLFGGYKFIFKSANNRFGGKDSEKFILLILVLYTAYAGVMAFVYFFGVFFLWIFGSIMTKLNTWYLLKRGHSVLKINELFGSIDRASQDIQSEKIELQGLLEEAHENNWQDGLLLKINAGIQDVNISAGSVVDDVIRLRATIEASRYKDMFSFSVYNAWIKKQVADPLSSILRLLLKHKNIIAETIEEIESQIQQTSKKEYQSSLSLQIKRLEIQKGDIDRFIPMLETALEKLRT